MAHFKTVMAFPMFATVVWLVWVLGQQVGIDGAAALLALLLALAFAAWALGSPVLGPAPPARVCARGAGCLVAAACSGSRAAPRSRGTGAGRRRSWQPGRPIRVAQARAAGPTPGVSWTSPPPGA